MRQIKNILAVLLVLSLSLSLICATTPNVQRLSFDHLLYMNNITTSPFEMAPGQEATLSFNVENTGDQFIRDIRVNLGLPSEFAPYKDTDTRKMAQLNAGESQELSFNIIPLPATEDGVYKLSIITRYLNYVGEEREENNTVSLIVGSSPKLLVELTSSEIYKGNNLGNVKVKVINDNSGNIKFLKVQLANSTAYTVIGSDLDYVGDLNSDDYSDVSFKISLNDNVKVLELPITLSYKDALNKDYIQEEKIAFKVPTASEAGIKKSYSWLYLLIIILAIGGYIAYRRYNKNMTKMKKAAVAISSKF